MTENKTAKASKRYSVEAPGPAAASFAKYLLENKGVDITPGQVQAMLSYHAEWQRNRGPEREQLAAEAKAAKEQAEAEKLLAREAKIKADMQKIAAIKKAQKSAG